MFYNSYSVCCSANTRFISVQFIKYVIYVMWLRVYNLVVNVHACEQVHWARSAGNSAIENVCMYVLNVMHYYDYYYYHHYYRVTASTIKRVGSDVLKSERSSATMLPTRFVYQGIEPEVTSGEASFCHSLLGQLRLRFFNCLNKLYAHGTKREGPMFEMFVFMGSFRGFAIILRQGC